MYSVTVTWRRLSDPSSEACPRCPPGIAAAVRTCACRGQWVLGESCAISCSSCTRVSWGALDTPSSVQRFSSHLPMSACYRMSGLKEWMTAPVTVSALPGVSCFRRDTSSPDRHTTATSAVPDQDTAPLSPRRLVLTIWATSLMARWRPMVRQRALCSSACACVFQVPVRRAAVHFLSPSVCFCVSLGAGGFDSEDSVSPQLPPLPARGALQPLPRPFKVGVRVVWSDITLSNKATFKTVSTFRCCS